jgi:hypothetical protein
VEQSAQSGDLILRPHKLWNVVCGGGEVKGTSRAGTTYDVRSLLRNSTAECGWGGGYTATRIV